MRDTSREIGNQAQKNHPSHAPRVFTHFVGWGCVGRGLVLGGGGERKRIAPVEKLYRRIGAEPRPFGLTAPDAEASAMACSPEG